MELVLGGGLAAIGKYISDNKSAKKENNLNLPKHHKTHVKNIYSSDNVNKNRKYEKRKVDKKYARLE